MTFKCGKFAQIFLKNEYKGGFIVGKVLCYDEKWVGLHIVTPDGYLCGMAIILLADVKRIKYSGEYLDGLCLLLEYHKSEQRDFVLPYQGNVMLDALSMAKEREYPIRLELHFSDTDDVIGYISCIKNNCICISQYTEFALEDGCSWVDIDSITRCHICDNRLEMLYVIHLKK